MPTPDVVLRLFLPEVTPPALARLRASMPDIRLTPLGFEIPLGDRAPEEILSLILQYGITVRATRITVRGPSG